MIKQIKLKIYQLIFKTRPLKGFLLDSIVSKYNKTQIETRIKKIKEISMLHTDVLTILYHFAKKCNGSILEIGPYIGGSTIAICNGITDSKQKKAFSSIEVGGKHTHPYMPSENILKDLKDNLKLHRVSHLVKILEGSSNEESIIKKVKEMANQEKIGMLVIDADGMIDRDLKIYLPFCKKKCLLILDDYISNYAQEKVIPTKKYINKLLKKRKIKCLGIYGFGTWIGIVKNTDITDIN